MKRFNQSYCLWEDQEYHQEEAAASGGGECMWPPRSYTCNFCKREFRSAQALGGHMNVHRRDRALLKQVTFIDQSLPSSPPSDQHHHKRISKSMVATNPSQFCLPRTSAPNLSASNTLSKVFPGNHSLVRPSHTYQCGSVVQVKMCTMGLDFGAGQIWKEGISYDDEKKDYLLRSKRCKKSDTIDHIALLPFFDVVKNVKGDPDVRATNSIEDLDLELRLGGAF